MLTHCSTVVLVPKVWSNTLNFDTNSQKQVKILQMTKAKRLKTAPQIRKIKLKKNCTIFWPDLYVTKFKVLKNGHNFVYIQTWTTKIRQLVTPGQVRPSLCFISANYFAKSESKLRDLPWKKKFNNCWTTSFFNSPVRS